MKKIFISPSKYIQGENELAHLNETLSLMGSKPLVIISKQDLTYVNTKLEQSQKNKEMPYVMAYFNGECSYSEINRLKAIAHQQHCDVIVGIGGGKSLDTAKAIGHFEKLPVVVIPTIASTDAPCSSLAVIYTDEGEFESYMYFDKNPDLVLVDTSIIAKAPVRFLVSGMGDALSTVFEARACAKSKSDNIPNGKSGLLALEAAELCYKTLMEDSYKAKIACESNVVTSALENIVEANILLSGIGFESSGLAAAHAIHNGLTTLSETHHCYHGEKVAFGVIVQLVLENAPQKTLNTVIDYCKMIGLPTCLADLGVENVTRDKIMKVAETACLEGESIYNMPVEIDSDKVYSAIIVADKLGA